MDKGKSIAIIHINNVGMTFRYEFARLPMVGEFVWINHESDSGLYKIVKLVHTPTVGNGEDAWIQADPFETGLQYVDSDNHSVVETLDKIFETKKVK